MRNLACKLINLFLDLLFPLECLGCRKEGFYLCADCFWKLKINSPQDLSRAQKNVRAPEIKEVYIAGDYEDKVLNKLIIKYKYNFLSPLGKFLADFLILFWKTAKLATEFIDSKNRTESILVIPIPLSKKRLRWRGFNQAEILAREFCLAFNYQLSLNLKRKKHCPPQAELNEAERLANIQSVFSWNGQKLNGQTIIIIDDVVTTGATLNEAAKTLKASGAGNIYALVLAKG